jgi:hypothetical protein
MTKSYLCVAIDLPSLPVAYGSVHVMCLPLLFFKPLLSRMNDILYIYIYIFFFSLPRVNMLLESLGLSLHAVENSTACML